MVKCNEHKIINKKLRQICQKSMNIRLRKLKGAKLRDALIDIQIKSDSIRSIMDDVFCRQTPSDVRSPYYGEEKNNWKEIKTKFKQTGV